MIKIENISVEKRNEWEAPFIEWPAYNIRIRPADRIKIEVGILWTCDVCEKQRRSYYYATPGGANLREFIAERVTLDYMRHKQNTDCTRDHHIPFSIRNGYHIGAQTMSYIINA